MMKSFSKKLPLFIIVLITGFFLSCEDNTRRIDYSTVPEAYSISGVERIETESGLAYHVIEEGSGQLEVNPRDQIDIYYTKRVRNNLKKIISSSFANGVTQPVSSAVTGSRIIAEEGFREGVLGMKEGEIRVLIVPPSLAYGSNPRSPYVSDSIWIEVQIDEIVYL